MHTLVRQTMPVRSVTLMTLYAILGSVAIAAVPPVVIIPGDGSNQLEARLNKTSSPHWHCSKKNDWYRLWLRTADLLTIPDCFADNIRLVVDPDTGRATNAPGVETRVPYFGSTEAFEELDPSVPFHGTAAFRNMVQAFLDIGLVKNQTLRGAPYDFRYTPDSLPEFGPGLKRLVEEASAASAGERVTLVSHSMGGLHTLYFLQQQTPEWKQTYIKQWISISTPFAGAAKTARMFASGDNQGLPVDPAKLKEEQSSSETNIWLSPFAHVYMSSVGQQIWNGKVIVETPSKNFTADDADAFLQAVGYEVGSKVLSRVKTLTDLQSGPGVPVLCMYSTGVATPEKTKYSSNGFEGAPEIVTGDGDGTVNVASLKVCETWANTKTLGFDNIDHAKMISEDAPLKAVIDAVRGSAVKARHDFDTVVV